MNYIKWQRRMEKGETRRINIQLKMTSLEQVCFMCMFIFKLSICNCYCELYKMAKKNERRRKLSNKYSTQNDIIGAVMLHVHVYI